MELGEPPGRDDGDCRAKARSRGQCFYRLHRVRCAGAQPFRCPAPSLLLARHSPHRREDRKSTRLNSSHLVISYAVFCLKKKKTSAVLVWNGTYLRITR